jgi:hypothetical protein
MATPTSPAPRSVHEDVLPPVPLPSTTRAASVNGDEQQRLWLSTIEAMAALPNANHAELAEIRSHITDGVSLPFLTTPVAITYANTPAVQENADAVRTRLQEYMAFGAVRELPASHDTSTHGIQPLHVIIKAGKKPRLVIDLSRNLNSHLQYEYFNYSSVDDAVEAASPNCWFGKLDLTNCFLSFPLHPEAQPYFCFRFDDKLFQFTHMPFGLSTAPRVCTLLLSVVAFALSQHGIRPVRYLDDFLPIGASEDEVRQQLHTAPHVIEAFGLVVNPDKTEGPSQSISFLGVQLDSVQQTLSCTPARVAELTTLLRSLRHQRVITRHHAESLIGKLSFAAQVLPGARPFMRRMLDIVHACTSKRRSTPIHIGPSFRADVRFWLHHLSDWNGTQQWRSSRASPFVFASDASLQGFGFYLESTPTPSMVDSSAWPQHLWVGATFSGTYSAEHAQYHQSHTQIAWCELLAVVAAASTYAPYLRNQSMLFVVDNNTDAHIINRQATRSKALAGLLRQLYSIALQYNIRIQAVHRPGIDNTLADFLSRPALHQHGHVAQWCLMNPPHASRLSSVSLVSSAQFVNSFSSFPAVPSESTPDVRTVRTRRRLNSSALPSALIPAYPSASITFAQSSSCTLGRTASPPSPDSSQQSSTMLLSVVIPNSRAVTPTEPSVPALTIGMATPTSANPSKASPSRTYASSVLTSPHPASPTPATGALACLPSTAYFALESTLAAPCA